MSEMSNEAWEKVQRVKMYRVRALEVLKDGGAISELEQVTDMGMHLRVAIVKERIVEILERDISDEEKAQLIAEELIEI